MLLLRNFANWTFFTALLLAPWFYGGTTAISIVVVNWLLGATVMLWIVRLILRRRRPWFPKLLVFSILALLAIGAWMTLNAHSIYDPEFARFSQIACWFPAAPGSVDYANSIAWLIRAALLMGTILFVADLSRDDKALLQLWSAIAIAAGSISLLGLLQKATGATSIFWGPHTTDYSQTFFA